MNSQGALLTCRPLESTVGRREKGVFEEGKGVFCTRRHLHLRVNLSTEAKGLPGYVLFDDDDDDDDDDDCDAALVANAEVRVVQVACSNARAATLRQSAREKYREREREIACVSVREHRAHVHMCTGNGSFRDMHFAR